MTRRVWVALSAALLLAMAILLLANWRQQGSAYRFTASAAARPTVAPLATPPGDVDVNTASAGQLTALYGVGDKLADEIVRTREADGPFDYLEDLTTVNGIGPKKLAGFRDQLAQPSRQP